MIGKLRRTHLPATDRERRNGVFNAYALVPHMTVGRKPLPMVLERQRP